MPPSVPKEWLEEAGVGLKDLHDGPADQQSDEAFEAADPLAAKAPGQSEGRRQKPGRSVLRRPRQAPSDAKQMSYSEQTSHQDEEPGALALLPPAIPRWLRGKSDRLAELPGARPPWMKAPPRNPSDDIGIEPKARAQGSAQTPGGTDLRR